MHTLRFPYFLIKSDHFQALEIHESEKLLVHGPDSERKTLLNVSVHGGGSCTPQRALHDVKTTTSGTPPNRLRMQLDQVGISPIRLRDDDTDNDDKNGSFN